MFYDLILLHPQHKSGLRWPWVAGTRGVNAMKVQTILNCNITKISEQIEMFIKSESHDVKKRFSLRFGAILISGVVRIYQRQVILLFDEIKAELMRAKTMTPIDFPKRKLKRPRQKKIITETPESIIAVVDKIPEFEGPDLGIVQARLDEITLREQMTVPVQQNIEAFPDDFGPPRDAEDIREPVQENVIVEVHAPPESPLRQDTKIPMEKEPLIAEAVPSSTMIPEILIEQIIDVSPKPAKPESLPELPPVVSDRSEPVIPPPEEEVVVRRKIKTRKFSNFLRIQERTKFYIIRPREIPVEDPLPKLVAAMPRFVLPKDLWPSADVDVNMVTEETAMIQKRAGPATASSSLVVPKSVDTVTTPTILGIGTPLTPRGLSVVESTPRGVKRSYPRDQTVTSDIAAAASAATTEAVTPCKRAKVVSIEEVHVEPPKEVPSEVAEIEQFLQTDTRQPVVVETQSPPESWKELERLAQWEARTAEKSERRLEQIMEVVMNWPEERGELTPIELCKAMNNKVNKMNMAAIFGSLLVLAKYLKIELHSEPDSCELRCITQRSRVI